MTDKEKILKLFKEEKKILSYSDIIKKLNIGLKKVWFYCNELEKEGKIEQVK